MEHNLKLSDGTKVPLYFGTWSLMRFCERNGNLSFTQMQELFSKELSYKHIVSLFLCGAEHHARKYKKPFDYSDVDAADWIDEIGGITSERFAEVMSVVGTAINPKYQGIETISSGEEKKSAKKKAQHQLV